MASCLKHRNLGFSFECRPNCVGENVSELITAGEEHCKVSERFLGRWPLAEEEKGLHVQFVLFFLERTVILRIVLARFA